MGSISLFPKLGKKKAAMPAPRGASAAPAAAAVELVYGVDWRALDGIGPLGDQANGLAKKNKCKAYALYETQGEGADSLAGFIKTKVGNHTLVPAAAVFANAIQSATGLSIGPDSSGTRLALIGLLQGMPSPSYDKVGTVAEILEAANEYSTYLAKGGALYVHQAVGQVPEMEAFCTRYLSLTTLVKALPGSEDTSALAAFKFVDAGSKPLTKILLGAGAVCVLAALSFAGYSFYADQLAEKELKKAKEKTDLQTYVVSRDAAFNAQSTLVASGAAPVLWDYIRPRKDTRAQWRLVVVDCAGSNCIWTYNQRRDATFLGIVQTLVDQEVPRLDMARLDTSMITNTVLGLEKAARLDLSSVVESADFTVSFGTTAQIMQRAGLKVALSATEPLGAADAARKLKANHAALRKAGTWTITGPSDTFVDAMRRLPGNATLSNVQFKLAEQGDSYTATGRYFTR
jgi:hypothetical protein